MRFGLVLFVSSVRIGPSIATLRSEQFKDSDETSSILISVSRTLTATTTNEFDTERLSTSRALTSTALDIVRIDPLSVSRALTALDQDDSTFHSRSSSRSLTGHSSLAARPASELQLVAPSAAIDVSGTRGWDSISIPQTRARRLMFRDNWWSRLISGAYKEKIAEELTESLIERNVLRVAEHDLPVNELMKWSESSLAIDRLIVGMTDMDYGKKTLDLVMTLERIILSKDSNRGISFTEAEIHKSFDSMMGLSPNVVNGFKYLQDVDKIKKFALNLQNVVFNSWNRDHVGSMKEYFVQVQNHFDATENDILKSAIEEYMSFLRILRSD